MTRGRIAAGAALACAWLGLAALATPGAPGQQIVRAEYGERIEQGRRIYSVYCSNCHGERGKGDGSIATYLTVAPTDLTRLRARNDGVFPEERTRNVIDGRDDIRGHAARDMPIWGLSFREWDTDVDQENAIRAKIERLVDYLKTVQE